ncbi:IS3 family transposase [Arcanobacterium hippocoleae]
MIDLDWSWARVFAFLFTGDDCPLWSAVMASCVVDLVGGEWELCMRVEKRRYSSYEGEVSPAPEDHIKRDFHAEQPNQKWLTDVSEFAGPDGKVYFSPIMDCYDGYIVAYRRQRNAEKTLTQGMFEDAIATLSKIDNADELPILHSDRGGHYRCKDWIARTNQAGIRRSMSKKGCSPDNARCEGFFGTMKNEMFYGRSWKSVTEIEQAIDWYVNWHNNTRIKTELGRLTIQVHREKTLTTKPSK